MVWCAVLLLLLMQRHSRQWLKVGCILIFELFTVSILTPSFFAAGALDYLLKSESAVVATAAADDDDDDSPKEIAWWCIPPDRLYTLKFQPKPLSYCFSATCRGAKKPWLHF